MWATSARYQATVSGRLRSLSWLECSDVNNTGWLANTGADNGSIGINWVVQQPAGSDSEGLKNYGWAQNSTIYKSCFNLKGHTGEVLIVRFSPKGDRLATYDSSGHTKLWTNRIGLYSPTYDITIEQTVCDMQWSPCGYFIAVCGEHCYIQMLSGTNYQILHVGDIDSFQYSEPLVDFMSCAWNDCSTQLALGTSTGEVVVVNPNDDVHCSSTLIGKDDDVIKSLNFFGPVQEIQVSSRQGPKIFIDSQALSVYLNNGEVIFNLRIQINCYSVRIQTHLVDGMAERSTDGTTLAVIGYQSNSPRILAARFLDQHGDTIISVDRVLQLPQEPDMTLHSICWGMSNSTIFLSCGSHLYSMAVQYSLPRLQDLCRQYLTTTLCNQQLTATHIPLPRREIEALNSCIPNLVPVPFDVTGKDAVQRLFKPPGNNKRLLCLLSYSADEDGKESYTLMYEYMGRHIPLLKTDGITRKGFKVTTAIRPAFPVAPSNEMWANLVQRNAAVPSSQTPQVSKWKVFRQRFLRRVQPSLQLTTGTNSEDVQNSAVQSSTPPVPKPVLAKIKGSIMTNRYHFSSSLHNNSDLGSLDIYTYYIRCAPRKLTLALTDSAVQLVTKRPYWNPAHMHYQIDFGGRITQDCVNNYQFEHEGQMVFQLGKVSDNDFALDFQYPFSPITALCTALTSIASITEDELK